MVPHLQGSASHAINPKPVLRSAPKSLALPGLTDESAPETGGSALQSLLILSLHWVKGGDTWIGGGWGCPGEQGWGFPCSGGWQGGLVEGKRKQGRGVRRGSGGGPRGNEAGTGITPEAAAGKGTRGQDRVSGESGARWDFPGQLQGIGHGDLGSQFPSGWQRRAPDSVDQGVCGFSASKLRKGRDGGRYTTCPFGSRSQVTA